MGFARRILRSFGKASLHFQFKLTEDGISIHVLMNKKQYPTHELLSGKVFETLPEQVRHILAISQRTDLSFCLPYPDAAQLNILLKRNSDNSVTVDDEALTNLQVVDRPNNFSIEWNLDAETATLTRILNNAQQYLGAGWFCDGQNVWRLDENIPAELFDWLSKSRVTENQIYQCISEILPIVQQQKLPLKCDIKTVTHPPQARIQILDSTIRVLHFNLTINEHSGIQLCSVPQDKHNLLGENTIFVGWASAFTPQLLQATSRQGVKLEGDAILAFLQDDLLPRATYINFDQEHLLKQYPIYDTDSLNVTWQLEHKQSAGIGEFVVVPYLRSEQLTIPLFEAYDWFTNQNRFQRIKDGWVELTRPFKIYLFELRKRGIRPFTLTPDELLHGNSDRLQQIGLSPPEIRLETAESDAKKQAKSLLQQAYLYGMPIALSGLQQSIRRIISEVCIEVIEHKPNLNILWAASRRKVDEVKAQLESAILYRFEESRIVVSPHSEISARSIGRWDILVIEDADLILGNVAVTLNQIERKWTVATMAKPNWSESKRRVERLLQALKLDARNLERFKAHFHFEFQDEETSFFERITSPFRRIITGNNTTEDSDGTPIPPRKDLTRPAEASSSENRPRNRLSQRKQSTDNYTSDYFGKLHIRTSGGDFIAEAKRLADYVENTAISVPFMQYYPTYAAMTGAQQRWYFYWRSQMRQGNMLATDTSYLFVHVYECINVIGFDTPQTAYDHLVKLWRHYRVLNPKLDRYLVDWIADFIVVHKLNTQPLEWYWEALKAGAYADVDLAVEAWLQSDGQFDNLPVELLYQIAGYSPKKNKFYREHENPETLEDAYRKGLSVVDRHLRQQTSKGLLEISFSGTQHNIKRRPFSTAIHGYPQTELTIGQARNWLFDEKVSEQLTAIIKYTENLLRKKAGVSSRLRGFEIPDEWAQKIDAAFDERAIIERPKQKLILDQQKLATIQAESLSIRERLIEEAPETETPLSEPVATTAPEQQIKVAEAHSANLVRPADTPEHLLTDLAEIAQIIGRDRPEVIALFRILQNNNWQASPKDMQQAVEDGFLNLIIDNINDRAVETLGDNLLFYEEQMWVVAEDFTDELDFILKHPNYQQTAGIELHSSEVIEAFAELEDDWAAFAQQLQAHHWEAIAALLSGQDVETRVETVARTVHKTANVLIDELNLFALDYIGDNIIDYDDRPTIIEEYLESLSGLLHWATENAVMEA